MIKNLLNLSLLFLVATVSFGQQEDIPGPVEEVKSDETVEIFEFAEKSPEFPGGTAEMMKYIGDHLEYPVIAKENGVQGKVYVQFVIDSIGNINHPVIVKGAHPILDKEAIRVIESMPKWIPGEQKGKPVNVMYTLPIMFKLD